LTSSVHNLARGGTELWDGLHKSGDTADLTALIVEAARVKDRLDQLHLALSTSGIVDMVETRDGIVQISVDNALVEARQQASALRSLLNDIAKRRGLGRGEEDDGLADL
jgi:hypothetical protein